MSNETTVYEAPNAPLIDKDLQPFNESFESIEAFEGLKIMWMLRAAADGFLIVMFAWTLYSTFGQDSLYGAFFVFYLVFIAVSMLEIYFIIRFFLKDPKSIVALHIFSALSLLNFPFGTGFSIYHFVRSRNLEWPPSR